MFDPFGYGLHEGPAERLAAVQDSRDGGAEHSEDEQGLRQDHEFGFDAFQRGQAKR
ncbi:hypothetical protein D3C75_1233210 [compost metagenome]